MPKPVPSATQLANELADRNRRPFTIAADAQGSILTPGRTYQGDIWHSDIHRAVRHAGVRDASGEYYLEVCRILTSAGFHVHS